MLALSDPRRGMLVELFNAFPSYAFASGIAEPIRGRFEANPILVPGSPAESGLRTVEIWFYYDRNNHLPRGVPAPRQGDRLVIDAVLYEIIDVLRDDIGEDQLQLHRSSTRHVTWKDASGAEVVWNNGDVRWY
jgi:hypothetical protein